MGLELTTAGTPQRDTRAGRRLLLALAAFLSLSLALSAAPALAATVTDDRPFLFAFDGSDTTAGLFTHPESTAVDYSTGAVYVLNTAGSRQGTGPGQDPTHRVIDKFDPSGVAQDFSALGTSSLDGSATPGGAFGVLGFFGAGSVNTDLAVDNSGGATQGRIYVSEASGPIHAFAPDGTYLWTLPSSTVVPSGIAVDPAGHLWVVDGSQNKALEFDSAGSPPAQIGSLTLTAGNGFPAHPAVDQTGNDLYVADAAGSNSPTVSRYVGGAFDSILTTKPSQKITIDQSQAAGHLFTAHADSFSEFDSSGALLANFNRGQLIGDGSSQGGGWGIAYNPTLDRVYVSDLASKTVKVFGPITSGTVPDVTSEETDAITRTEATAHATLNPQALANSYHFEWVKGTAYRLTVEATAGKFSLSFRGQTTGGLGSGIVTGGSDQVQNVTTTSGSFRVGQTITGEFPEELAPGTTIIACSPECGPAATSLTISSPATGSNSPAHNTLRADDIDYDVTAAQLEATLAALSTIGAGNVSVTGTPADGAGSPGEYDIVFENALAAHDGQSMQLGEGHSGLGGQATLTTTTAPEPWSTAKSQPAPYPGIEPPDGADHPVSYQLSGLEPNTTYDLRLVATNAEPDKNGLSAYASPPDTFTTLLPLVPTATNLSISAITTSSAHVAATINPQEATTTWKVLRKALPFAAQAECEALATSAFETAKQGTIPSGTLGTVDIAADLSGLEPAQTNCVRVTAQNGNPKRAIADTVFQTLAIPPTDAATAFAAPRTDTSARINARINPQGEADLTYRFEWSTDGSTWTALPDRVSTTDARDQVVVADELTGLAPDTTYHYRFFAANSAGPASPQGEERTFTTRSAAEVAAASPPSCPNQDVRAAQHSAYLGFCRAVEFLNNPDKGNQNVRMPVIQEGPTFTADGRRALWEVLGGAPGAPNGTNNTFLARRTDTGLCPSGFPSEGTDTGWCSRALAPPAAQQLGSGEFTYSPLFATAGLSRFIFNARQEFVRLDDNQGQELLGAHEVGRPARADLTDDAAHVLLVDSESHQLEDIGTGAPEILSIMPGGAPSSCGLEPGGRSFAGPGDNAIHWRPGYHWIAATDASRVFFGVAPSANCAAPVGIYVRNREAEQTTLIDPGVSGQNVGFIRATDDGRSAYFVTQSALHPADSNGHRDVYRWDESPAPGGTYTCLTCVVADANLRPTAVMVSDDFSHLYFESDSQLAPGATPGDHNLYVLSGGLIRFVAEPNSDLGALQSAQLSADGDVLLFAAQASRSLTSDQVGPCGAGPCQELYRYDDRDQSLECVSCLRGGLTTHGAGGELSADGSTIAFPTEEALLSSDVNNGTDIYEWRNGARRLITDGVTEFRAGDGEPKLWGLDATGANVFFSLAGSGLTGFEADGFANLYDARIGGGFEPPSPTPHCSEDSCQGPLQPPPPTDQPGSSGLTGPGNQGRDRTPPTTSTKTNCKKKKHSKKCKKKGGKK